MLKPRWQRVVTACRALPLGLALLTPVQGAELASRATAPGTPDPGTVVACAATPDSRLALEELERSSFEVADAAVRQRQAQDLIDCLQHPDPKIRDAIAFQALYTWLRGDAIEAPTRLALAGQLLPMVEADEDPAGFRRPFAALALAEVVRADRLAPSLPDDVRRRIVAAASHYLATTRDYRGYDPQAGWRHAVAHGADLVLQLGVHPATTEAEARALVESLTAQIAPVGISYVHGEPDRLARAVFFIHGRGLVADEFWDAWFERIGAPPPQGGPAATGEQLARRHDLLAFLHALAFAARANPGPDNDRLGELAHRELLRLHAG